MPSPFDRPRLTADEVAAFQRDGFVLYRKPVLKPETFARLRAHFDDKLAALPPGARPEEMDVPHFTDPALFAWLFADEVLDLVEPVTGPDIVLFSSHFICKPKGTGKRVPWHEDSTYWRGMVEPMEVVTLWLAIDPSTRENGCMYLIPGSHRDGGYSHYEVVDREKNLFGTEIVAGEVDESHAVPVELAPNEASLHDGRIVHGSPPNTSEKRRCGYTMRYFSARVRFNKADHPYHQIYLARGKDRAGNEYADPSRAYDEFMRFRLEHTRRK